MSTDFRKQFENPSQSGMLRPVETPELNTLAAEETTSVVEENLAVDERPGAISFPLNWFARLGGYASIAGAFGFVAYKAINGDPDRDLIPMLIGCGVVLLGLCLMPAKIVIDDRGVHQLWVMGLYEYSIAKSAILSYESTTRAKLRRDGKLRFEWRHEQGDLSDELEDVVYVASKYGKRYILHSNVHQGHFGFIESLEKQGVPAKGYENWDKFMADRGVPVDDVRV